jgi:hypothetical protein
MIRHVVARASKLITMHGIHSDILMSSFIGSHLQLTQHSSMIRTNAGFGQK